MMNWRNRASPPESETRQWQGIVSQHPPYDRYNRKEIARQAADMLAERKSKYPALIENGQIDGQFAADQIAIWSIIAADWHWIAFGEGAPAAIETLQPRRDAIDASLRALAEILCERGGFTDELNDKAHLVIAMRWHLEPE